MPNLELDQQSARKEESSSTLLDEFKKAFQWIKQHPILIIAILAGLITASAFIGGALLAAPAVLLIMTQIGTITSGVCSVIFLLMSCLISNPYEGKGAGERDEMIASGLSSGETERGFALLAAFAGIIITILSICYPPILGVVLCGVFATALVSGLSAGIGHLVSSHGETKPSNATTDEVSSQQQYGHPSLQRLLSLPPSAEKQNEKTDVAATTAPVLGKPAEGKPAANIDEPTSVIRHC